MEANPYKADNAQSALEADPKAVISFYATGEPGKNWEDLCRGPHVPSTGRIGAFKVTSVAGGTGPGCPRRNTERTSLMLKITRTGGTTTEMRAPGWVSA